MDRSTKGSSDRARLEETVKAAQGPGGSRTGKIGSSQLLVRLASRLGISTQTLAVRIPEETVRKTKYPVYEDKQADGSTVYRHPVHITEGPRHK